MLENQMLTVKELAELLNMSERNIYFMIQVTKLPNFKIGSLVRFDKTEVLKWLQDKHRVGKTLDNA